jgi:cell wall-associated NlpC family hydrolase
VDQPVEPSGKRLDRTTGRNSVRRLRLTAAGVVVLALLAPSPAALADRGNGGQAFPSQQQVQQAQQQVAQRQRDVATIRARLLLAGQQVQLAQQRAEQASEAYNGAMWHLQQATQRLTEARAQAAQARSDAAVQRDRIGALVAASYQQGDQLSALNALLSADGPQGVLEQYAGFQGASTALQSDYQRFTASEAVAQVFEQKAAEAKQQQVRLAAKAREARDAAAGAAQQAQAEAATVAVEKQRLIRELATAQGVSVRLAAQRQQALAEIARKRAEEAARRAAARARAAAEARARAEAKAAAEAKAQAARAAAAAAAAAAQASAGDTQTAPVPPPVVTSPPPTSSGGAARAIAFARAQLGEPYLWGGAGPDAWDCSGLTQAAWGAAGVYLPHFAEAQYYDGTPIPISAARPGDLLFWTSNGLPSGIHHVALYVGNGAFIEAPHTGAYVRYNSIYNWYPDYAVRL